MDYSNLVFKVDVKELVDADKKVSQLGNTHRLPWTTWQGLAAETSLVN